MDEPSYFSKQMFGGLAIYFKDLMVLVLTESPGDREWRGRSYNFDLWNGALICTSREHHKSLQASWPALISHPVLGKWLYMPMSHSEFESSISDLVDAIAQGDPRVGIVPGQKGRRKSRKKSSKKKKAQKKKTKKKKVRP